MVKKGLISSIQPYSIKDGPGIRTTVFCVGCNLRCRWCANPELIVPEKKIMHFHEAGKDHDEQVGYCITSEELAQKLIRDQTFYEVSKGGVTFSGGEPALQSDFVIETAQLLHKENIHSALDTAGNVSTATMQRLAEVIDLFLYDIKAVNPQIHKNCTGADNQQILDNLSMLADAAKDIIIRMVIVPGYNDQDDDIHERFRLIKELGSAVKRTDILPYHDLGRGKYKALGYEYSIKMNTGVSERTIKKIQKMADEVQLPIRIMEMQ